MDYAIPAPIADVLMKAITTNELFARGEMFAIPINNVAAEHSYFVIPTRDAQREFAGDFHPTKMVNMVMGQIPEGGGRG